MTSIILLTAALILANIATAQNPGSRTGYAEEVLHKNSISPLRYPSRGNSRESSAEIHQGRRNSKSMSFIDYFFPSSRSVKGSNRSQRNREGADKVSTVDTQTNFISSTVKIDTITPPTVSVTNNQRNSSVDNILSSEYVSTPEEGRATGSTKKATTTSGKRRTSVRTPTSTTPKSKLTQKVSTKIHSPSSGHTVSNSVTTRAPTTHRMTTQRSKETTKDSTASQKTTHYTIYPSVIMTKTNPPTSISKSRVPESTTVKIGGMTQDHSTQSEQKVSLSELAKVSESVTDRTTQNADAPVTEINGREGEIELRDRPQIHNVKINDQTKKETVPLPAGSTSVLAKPTKYHYYPHNQHIYLLPECAIQQVCNAVYVRLNYTQPLCACPARHRDPCSASLNADDLHTTQLTTDSKKKYAHKAVTLVKTCEATSEMRECRAPRDWSLLALQNVRTGKSHYLVICRCPEEFVLEGPMSHDQPTYASVPGIRVYGMMCVQPIQDQFTSDYSTPSAQPTSAYKAGYSQPSYNQETSYTRYPGYVGPGVYYNRMARMARDTRHHENVVSPPFPWEKARELALTADWEN